MNTPPAHSESSDETPPRKRRRLKWVLIGLLVLVVGLVARPVLHLWNANQQDIDVLPPLPDGWVDDASRMNATEVEEVWKIPHDRKAAEAELVSLLKRAAREGLPVSIAGARHSMGGHTIAEDGIVLDMRPFNQMSLDEEAGILTVGSGAIWEDVIPFLDERGHSISIMQSNNSFTVGGSISVNCHGWQFGMPPIGSTVQSFRLMKANGEIVRCSREENAELFSLVLGGYGLFGVILDVELRVVPNERYRVEQQVVSLEESIFAFDRLVQENRNVAMIYARMSIVPDEFLSEVIINSLHPAPSDDGSIPALEKAGMVKLRRNLFRGSVGSDYGKELRWQAETQLQPHLMKAYFSRNQLLNESVEVYQERRPEWTDILHEYFVPRSGVIDFVDAMRGIIPEHGADLLNVTVRHVKVDEDTHLRYADKEMFCFVMLFSQPRSEAGDKAMQILTRELIDAALDAGGRYYLPYRLHATDKQFHEAYPQAKRFFELKRKYDPNELFRNAFYDRYGKPLNLARTR